MKKVSDEETAKKEKQKSTSLKGRGKKLQRASYKADGRRDRNRLRKIRRHVRRMGQDDDGNWHDQFAYERFIELGGKDQQLERRA